MKIGYVVEGSTDEAFLQGLKSRWCPDAEMEELGFRGSLLRHRDYPRIVATARFKGFDIAVFLTDSNNRDWNSVLTEEREQLQKAGGEDFLLGVADRNIECWLCADVEYISKQLGCDVSELRSLDDPKHYFQRLMGIMREDKKRDEIAELILKAPSLKVWLQNSPSFMHFYEEVKRIAALHGCRVQNELKSNRRSR